MTLRLSTKRKLADCLDEMEKLTRLLIETVVNKDDDSNPQIILRLLFEKHKQYEDLRKEAENQAKLQEKIDLVVENNIKLDGIIREFQEQMKKCEALLRTVLYYGRQKLANIQHAIKNPLDPAEIVAYSHRLSASYGLISPENWQAGDPRRPFPTDEDMRRGFLGHLNEGGNFRPSIVGALQESLVPVTTALMRNPVNPTVPSTTPLTIPVSSVFNPSAALAIPGTSQFSAAGLSPLPGTMVHPNVSSGPSHSSFPTSTSGNSSMPSSSFMLPGVNLVTSPTLTSSTTTQPMGSSISRAPVSTTPQGLIGPNVSPVPGTLNTQSYSFPPGASSGRGSIRHTPNVSGQRRSGGEQFPSSAILPGAHVDVMSSGADTPSPSSSASDD